MAFPNWLKFGKNKENDVNVLKLKEQSISQGAMAMGNQTAAIEAINRIMDQKTAPPKILVVADGLYSDNLTDYALKMAQRLDCEIVALTVSNVPLQYSGERRERETAQFYERAEIGATHFMEKAKSMGVKVDHLKMIGNQEKMISGLSAKDAGIRYVLTEPDSELSAESGARAQIPVFDLACSRI